MSACDAAYRKVRRAIIKALGHALWGSSRQHRLALWHALEATLCQSAV